MNSTLILYDKYRYMIYTLFTQVDLSLETPFQCFYCQNVLVNLRSSNMPDVFCVVWFMVGYTQTLQRRPQKTKYGNSNCKQKIQDITF